MIRLFNHYLPLRILLLSLIEAMVLFQAMVLGFEVRLLDQALPLPLVEAGVFTGVMLLMMTGLGLYESQNEPFRVMLQRLVVAYGLALAVMCSR